jgi:hypothetical protein
MAVRAGESEPVSGVNSLIYRENTGKFLDLEPLGRGETARFQPFLGLFPAISLKMEQGISSR